MHVFLSLPLPLSLALFEQVGTLSSLSVNASHNKIIELSLNYSDGSGGRSDAGKKYLAMLAVCLLFLFVFIF